MNVAPPQAKAVDLPTKRGYNIIVKQLDDETINKQEFHQPAELVMETVTSVMRAIKREMRAYQPEGMSMQQFHALRIVDKHPGKSLSALASHLGLTDASASKLVDGLVKAKLVKRIDAPEDRRKVVLNLTKPGRAALHSAREAALGRLAGILAELDENDLRAVVRAMTVLHDALAAKPTEAAI
jgi:DNA-binding MarR family transcriptional regulator